MKGTSKHESSFRTTMADGLRPLLKINYLLGVSNYKFTSTGHIHFSHSLFAKLRTALCLIFLSGSTITTLSRIIEVMFWSPVNNNNEGGFARFNKVVDLTCQFAGAVYPLMLILICIFRTNTTIKFFEEMGKYNSGIAEFAEPPQVRKVSRRMFVLHLFVMLVSGALLILRLFTSTDPHDYNLFRPGTPVLRGVVTASICIGAIVLTVLKYSAVAFIECFSVALATCFTVVSTNLTRYILEEASKWKQLYLGEP